MQKDFNNIKQFTVLNIGQGKNIKIKDFIYIIEKILKLKANIEIKKSEKGDMKNTKADINEIKKIGYIPKTNVFNGLTKFIEWYKNFY